MAFGAKGVMNPEKEQEIKRNYSKQCGSAGQQNNKNKALLRKSDGE